MAQYSERLDSHSPAWIFQTWASFAASVGTTAVGIAYLPVDHWIQAFLAMGVLFSIGSTFSLAKTVRDIHESHRQAAKMDSLV